jgi:hypothetical protein
VHDRIKLKPDPACRICRGRGEFNEYHGSWCSERLTCECVFVNAPTDAISVARIDAGEYEIEAPPLADYK